MRAYLEAFDEGVVKALQDPGTLKFGSILSLLIKFAAYQFHSHIPFGLRDV